MAACQELYEMFLSSLQHFESQNKSPVDFQSQMFWGVMSTVKVLIVGVPDVGYEPFAPQGEGSGVCFLLTVGRCDWGGVYGEIVSQLLILPASVWAFSHLPDVRSCSASFQVFSEEIALYVALELVCPREEMSLGPYYVTILDHL